MPKKLTLMGLYTDVALTGDALDKLRVVGIREEDMSIMMGVPYTEKMLGRPKLYEKVPWGTILGALTGFLIALFLTLGTQLLYPIVVGGHPTWAIPTSIVVFYELTMLGLALGTFLNMLWKNAMPSTRPQYYDHLINYSRIALLCTFDMRYEDDVRRAMMDAGAERVYEPERRPL
jgi:hypothetical protein